MTDSKGLAPYSGHKAGRPGPRDALARGRPVKIFYIGDYDPAGVLIDVSLEKELRTHLAEDLGSPIRAHRDHAGTDRGVRPAREATQGR